MFRNFSNLNNITGLSKFDTSRVTEMTSMFAVNFSLENISGLENWDVSSVETMFGMFLCEAFHCSIATLDPLKNWNKSNVTNMGSMFDNQESLIDASGINFWNISKVTNFDKMFAIQVDEGEYTLNLVHSTFKYIDENNKKINVPEHGLMMERLLLINKK